MPLGTSKRNLRIQAAFVLRLPLGNPHKDQLEEIKIWNCYLLPPFYLQERLKRFLDCFWVCLESLQYRAQFVSLMGGLLERFFSSLELFHC